MTWISAILLLVALIGSALPTLAWRGQSLAAQYAARRLAFLHKSRSALTVIITESAISSLPQPVQRYMRLTGSVGKPTIRNLQVAFRATMFRKPGDVGTSGPVDQFSTFDPPRHLFLMRARMFGLPVQILHDYDQKRASMTVRLASLYNLVDVHSNALARAETVTVLNDLCILAPSLLTDPRLLWRAIDDHQAAVTFTNGPHKVSATLIFNDAGELANFISDDRGALQSDGSLRLMRWSTPVGVYRAFEGRRVATQGEAIFHYPDGNFAYGRFTLQSIRFDVAE
jgi:hypothetical protein